MISKTIQVKILYALALLLILVSFWIFGRFTVDDAFISWRYGLNLIESGIWNYNPTTFDSTQAYTNPIYAVLSIIPALLGMDIVLFFKLVSLILVFASYFYFKRKLNKGIIWLLFLIAQPYSIVHIFSGLETFLYVVLLASLIISLYEKNLKQSFLFTILLFLTRPEAWLFVGLVPLYYVLIDFKAQNIKQVITRLIKPGVILIAIVISYFLFHYFYFDNILPNTFYIKRAGKFSLSTFVMYQSFALPLLFLFFRSRPILGILTFLYFAAASISYSSSELMMDYCARFYYHNFASVFIFGVFLWSQTNLGTLDLRVNNDSFTKSLKLKLHNVLGSLLVLGLIAVFALSFRSYGWVATYYPRLLNSHSELGKQIHHAHEDHSADIGIVIADAGALPYFSQARTLDYIGLGSGKIAHEGMSEKLLGEYQPNYILLYGTGDSIHNYLNQNLIYEWSQKNGFQFLGNTYWRPEYTLCVYSNLPSESLNFDFNKTKEINNRHNKEFMISDIKRSPFHYWHE